MEQWRLKAAAEMMRLYGLHIVDGTERGNEHVKDILRTCGLRESKIENYKNGSTAWCGYTGMSCYRVAGFNKECSIASAGKAIYVYGEYGFHKMNPRSGGEWCMGPDKDDVNRVWLTKECHEHHDALRICANPGDVTPEPVDLLVHISKRWNGHVMTCAAFDPGRDVITTMEGNKQNIVMPDGSKDEGLGHRELKLDDDYIDKIIKPSWIDFDDRFHYFDSQVEAESLLKSL